MWALRAVAVACLLMPVLGLAGCGFERQPFAAVTIAPAIRLEGNWLVYGKLPRLYEPIAGPNNDAGLTLSLSSDGKTLSGSAFLSGTCPSGETFGYLFGNAIEVIPDADGHFVTSSTKVYGVGFTLSGMAPNTTGEPWSGTYELTSDGRLGVCPFSASGSFTATPVGQLTGNFTGEGTVSALSAVQAEVPIGSEVVIKTALVQGAMLTTPGEPTSYGVEWVQGTLQISGLPCFSQGTPSKAFLGSMVGNSFQANFDMDDGSTAFLEGTIDNTSATRLLLNRIAVSGGKCAGTYEISLPFGATLTRES